MYFLLRSPEGVAVHHIWIFILLVIFSLIFTASARADKGDRMQQVIAFLFWAWTVDRMFIVWRYAVELSGESDWALETWTLTRHLSLLLLEISFYALALALIGAPVKDWLRGWLRWFLDEQ